MTLPVDLDTRAGTLSASTADLTACLVTKPFTDGAQGSTALPPDINCKITSKPELQGGTEMVLNLAAFTTAWSQGNPQFGIAIVATPSTSPGVWHLAVPGHKFAGTDHVETLVTYDIPTVDSPPAGPVAQQPNASVIAPAPLRGSGPVVSSGPAVTTPTVDPPPVVARQQPVAPRAFYPYVGFQYSAAFLLPLVLLLGMWFLIGTFTGDPTPAQRQRVS
jgi:hypothetical protein